MKALHSFIVCFLVIVVASAVTRAQSITSFSPLSGAPGSTVTIAGTGFSATPANNIVYFGPVRGSVTSASPTSLSVTVPSGATYSPLSVTILGTGKSVKSSVPFNPTFQGGDIDALALAFDQSVSVSGTVGGTTMADLNNDGKLDVLVFRTGSLAYFQNTSTGGSISFAAQQDISFDIFSINRVQAADMNADGLIDLIFAMQYSVKIYRNTGTASNPAFTLWQTIDHPDLVGGKWTVERGPERANGFMMLIGISEILVGGGDPFSWTDTYSSSSLVWVPNYETRMRAMDATIQDFDGDGHLDVAICYMGNYNIRVYGRVRVYTYRGAQGFPYFTPEQFSLWNDTELIQQQYNNHLDAFSLTSGDINGDGKIDLAVAGHFLPFPGVGMVSFLMNTGSTMHPLSWNLDGRAERVLMADFDGDAKVDVAYQTLDEYKIRVARNLSTPDTLVLVPSAEISNTLGDNSVEAADVDGDGKPDLVWPCDGASGFKVARNTSSGGTITFASPIRYVTSLEFQDGMSVGDLDGDGKPDVISVNPYQGTGVNVLKNAIPPYSLSQSVAAVQDPVISKFQSTTVTLQIKDVNGSNISTSGLTVAFSLTGSGTSTGTFGSTSYSGGGSYTADFTGTGVGTERTVSATVDGIAVSSSLPAIRVAGGSVSVAQSTVTISRPIVASGATANVAFVARDANGDTLTTGGLTGVTFFLAGSGTSSGSFGSVVDSSNGKYYAVFTGSTAGTAKEISARISTDTVNTSVPTVTVIAGVFSTSNSVLSYSPNPIQKYDTSAVTLQIKDGSGNAITTGGLNVKLEFFGSPRSITSTIGYLVPVVDNQNGTYTSQMVSTGTGSKNIIASIYNSGTSSYQDVSSAPSSLVVNARSLSLSQSTVTWGGDNDSTIVVGATTYFTVYVRNDKGEPYTESNPAVSFSLLSDGTSALNALEAPQNLGGGVYSALYQATTIGTPRTLIATLSGDTITSAFKTIAVTPSNGGINYPGYFQTAVPLDTIFTWNSTSSATSYRVKLNADSVNGQTLIDSSGITDTYLTVSGLYPNRTYHWTVSSFFNEFEGAAASDHEFTTVLATPLVTSPYDGELNITLPAQLTWRTVSGATSYRLQVASDTGFTSIVADESGITDTTFSLLGLIPGAKYRWRVRGEGSTSNSSFTPNRSFTASGSVGSPAIYFVKTDGADTLSGTAWGTAYATVQQALTSASAGDQIWVAAGTYKPTATSDRSISFQLKNGVAIYGGFAGTESVLGQRNWETNVTILSGDIDNDASIANNSYHVVVGNTYATAILDGFTITGGNADGAHGGGIYCSSGYPRLSNLIVSNSRANEYGGGMYNYNGSPALYNVTFTGNTSDNVGGGMFNLYGKPTLTNCSFIGNSAFDGGGMYNGTTSYPAPTSDPVLTNVVFHNNTATHFGGGLCNLNGAPVMTNVLFHENNGGTGGGIYAFRGNMTLTNVTLSNNVSNYGGSSEGGGMYIALSTDVTLRNVILWGNTQNQLYLIQSSTVTMYNSIVQGGLEGSGVLKLMSSVVVDSGGVVDADPLFLDASGDDLTVPEGSPAVNSGINSGVTTITDIAGFPRIVDGHVDMGVYEFQGTAASSALVVSENDSLYDFGSTNVGLAFSHIAPERNVYMFTTHYSSSPDSATFAGTPPTFTSQYRWVIAKTGDDFSSAVLTFDNVSTYPGVVDPSSIVVYRRDSAGTGNFSPITTSYDAGTDRLYATITSFSEFVLGSNSDILAAQLVSFTGSANRLNAELRWKTATEENNSGWDIERRFVSKEYGLGTKEEAIRTWTSIGFVEGTGTSTSAREYTFTDKAAKAGRHAYRLKQIDRSGAFAYSHEVEVEVGSVPRIFSLAQNYPNPFNPSTTIEFTLPDDGRVRLRIYDITGREVAKLVDEDRRAGELQQAVFDASAMATGFYIVRLQYADKQLVKKMVLIK